MTLITREMLEDAREDGLCPNQVAKAHGTYRKAIIRAEARTGIKLRRAAPTETKALRNFRREVQDMKPMDAVEHLLEVLEQMGLGDGSAHWKWPGPHMKPTSRALFRLLGTRPLRVWSKNQIMAALEEAGSQAESGHYVSVAVCLLRESLVGSGVVVENVWGHGYRLSAPDGYRFPWEVDG